jgi:hypothetical protein
VFDSGTLSIKEGDIVRVCGSYRNLNLQCDSILSVTR